MLRRLHSRLLAVALAMAVPAVSAADTPAPVPFKLGPGHSILIPVMIGEDGPFRFVLDTGSSRSAISKRIAARLSAPVVARSRVISWGSPALRARGAPGCRSHRSFKDLESQCTMIFGRLGRWCEP